MHKYFSPRRVNVAVDRLLPIVSVLSVVFVCVGLFFAVLASPPDYQQGEAVRIMYVHVPAAWMAIMLYFLVAMFGAASLIWKNPVSDILAVSVAPIGACFTVICLVTGAVWGKPIWGAWWVWDARLTSMLVLFFLYLGFIFLYHAYDDKEKSGKLAAILALIGCVNLPIIKFSVEWWNTLHQPASIIRSGGVSIDESMLVPLVLMWLGFFLFFLVVWCMRIKTEILRRKISRKQLY